MLPQFLRRGIQQWNVWKQADILQYNYQVMNSGVEYDVEWRLQWSARITFQILPCFTSDKRDLCTNSTNYNFEPQTMKILQIKGETY